MIEPSWWRAPVGLLAAGVAVSICAPAHAAEVRPGLRAMAVGEAADSPSGAQSGNDRNRAGQQRIRCVSGTVNTPIVARGGNATGGHGGRGGNGHNGQRGADGRDGARAHGESVIVYRAPGASNLTDAQCRAAYRRAQQRAAAARQQAQRQAAVIRARVRAWVRAANSIG